MRITAVLAAAVAAVVLAAGASSALAADRPSLVDQVAARLGVTPEQLRSAFQATLVARVDAAVAAGTLTPEQGARLKERIAKANGLGLGAAARKALGQKLGMRLGAKGPVATYLGMTREALVAELRKGQSLAQIAKAHGKSVDGLVAAMVAPLKAHLAKAVENDRLTKQRADALLERITGPPRAARPAQLGAAHVVAQAPGATSGSASRTTVPPSSARATVAVPPCSSTTRFTIARPSPEPGIERAFAER